MATTAGYWRIGNTEVIGDIERHVLDWDETSDQAVGNRHAFEVWADDKTTGNNIATLEIVSNAVAWYSSSALPWSLGTATYPVDSLYTAITATRVVYAGTSGLLEGDAGLTFNASTDTFTLGANHIYSQGAHGQTLAANDWFAGSGTSNFVGWDNSSKMLDIRTDRADATSYAATPPLSVGGCVLVIGDVRSAQTFTNGLGLKFHDTGVAHCSLHFKSSAADLEFGDSSASSSSIAVANPTFTLKGMATVATRYALANNALMVATPGWTLATADFAVGSSTSSRLVWDDSTLTLLQYGAGAAIFNQFSSVAGTNNVLNETGADIDTRIEGDTNANLFVCDAGLDALGFGAAPSSDRFLFVAKTWTSTSGAVYGQLLNIDSTPASNSTARIIGCRHNARHGAAFNLTELTALELTPQSLGSFSSGILGTMNGIRVSSTNTGAGIITNWTEIGVYAPSIGGGTPGTYRQLFLQDPGSFSVSTAKIAIHQLGTNAHNRLQGGVSIGADAAPTAGYVLDITGATYGTQYLNYGTTTKASVQGDAAFGIANSKQLFWDRAAGNLKFYRDDATLVHWIDVDTTGQVVFNEAADTITFRVEGPSLAYMFFANGADAALENIALLTTAEPNWNSLDRGIFLGDATTAPTGNPTAGGYLYAEAGALKWRGSSGTTTTLGPAAPECPRCGADFAHEWESDRHGYLAVCVPCLLTEFARIGGDRTRVTIPRARAA